MGDLPPGTRPQALDGVPTSLARDGEQSLPSSTSPHFKNPDNNNNNVPFYSQLSSLPQSQLRPDLRTAGQSSVQYSYPEHGTSPLNMSSIAGALPEFPSAEEASANTPGQQALPRSLSGASTSAVAYQLGQNLQMPAPGGGSVSSPAQYGSGYPGVGYQQPFLAPQGAQHGGYQHFTTNSSRMHPGVPMQAPYHNYPHNPQYMYYPSPYVPQTPYPQGYPAPGAPGQSNYDRRPSSDFPSQDGFTAPQIGAAGTQSSFIDNTGISRQGPISSIPRGPPRKPKQSGHALWVGNLPPGTTVVALKDHFSREATKDIESLFLISKSNCAFVNYRTEASCTAAMHRFHDSRFNGVRLVCRLRRSSAPASGVPTGPSAMTGTQQTTVSPPKTPQLQSEVGASAQGASQEPSQHKDSEQEKPPHTSTSANKFFIVKSLTLQDLELSVRNGIWATQSHNEDVLNKAFQSTENVYLIFSANKSGEYFGYARMTSPILEDGSRLIGSAPKPENIMDAPDVPKSIPTPATEWAPRGKIIDDSARGTIFWEAELSEPEGEEENAEKEDTQVDGDSPVVSQSWGKPFKIEWVSTNRLPFYRTRGLRNPWNANREVKIARDGTELEPSVGERLIQMFHRLGPSHAGAPILPPPGQPLGGPGMPQMRHF